MSWVCLEGGLWASGPPWGRNFAEMCVSGGLWASGPPWGRNFAEICVSGGRWASGPPWGRNFAEILVLGGLWASGPPWGRNFAEFCVLGSLRRISSLPGPKMADFRPPGPQDDGFPVSGAAPEIQTGGFRGFPASRRSFPLHPARAARRVPYRAPPSRLRAGRLQEH